MSDIPCIIMCDLYILSDGFLASEVARCLGEGNVDVLIFRISQNTLSPLLPPLSFFRLWLTGLQWRRQVVLTVTAGQPGR